MLHNKLNNTAFMLMRGFMGFVDHIHPYVSQRADSFGITPGMTVVDYGCGPGRYTVEFCRLVGAEGKVFAVDLLEVALRDTEARLKEQGIVSLKGSDNPGNSSDPDSPSSPGNPGGFGFVELKLAQGYDSGIPGEAADMVCAIDMFHHVEPFSFLREASRITKADGALLISGGHQTRGIIKKRVASSGLWELVEEGRQFLKFTKRNTFQ